MVETINNSFRTSIQWSRLIPDGTGQSILKLFLFPMIILMNLSRKEFPTASAMIGKLVMISR